METYSLKYIEKKSRILFMINYYSRDILEDPRVAALSLDDIEVLYHLDQEMVDNYRGELLLLEANYILNLI